MKRWALMLVCLIGLCYSGTACTRSRDIMQEAKTYLNKRYPAIAFGELVAHPSDQTITTSAQILGRQFRVTLSASGKQVHCDFAERAAEAALPLVAEHYRKAGYAVTLQGLQQTGKDGYKFSALARVNPACEIKLEVTCAVRPAEISDNLAVVTAGASLYLRMAAIMTADPYQQLEAQIVDLLGAGNTVQLLALKSSADGLMAEVKTPRGITGWLPAWSLANKAVQKAALAQQTYGVLQQRSPLCLGPDGSLTTPAGFALDAGTVVACLAGHENWQLVQTAPYANSDAVHVGWVEHAFVGTFEPSLSHEGWTKQPVTLYADDDGKPDFKEKWVYEEPLRFSVIAKQDQFELLVCSGGIIGWVDSQSILTRNPFERPN